MVDNQTRVKDSSSEAGPRGSKGVEDIRKGWSSACCQSSVGSDAWNSSRDGQSLQVQGQDKVDGEEWVSVTLSVVPGVKMEDVEEEQPARRKEHRRVPSKIAMDEVKVSDCETVFCKVNTSSCRVSTVCFFKRGNPKTSCELNCTSKGFSCNFLNLAVKQSVKVNPVTFFTNALNQSMQVLK
jgi:hypothetical protein